jgi:hypothetical protein
VYFSSPPVANPNVVTRDERTVNGRIHPIIYAGRLKRHRTIHVIESADPARRIRLRSQERCRRYDQYNNPLYVPHNFLLLVDHLDTRGSGLYIRHGRAVILFRTWSRFACRGSNNLPARAMPRLSGTGLNPFLRRKSEEWDSGVRRSIELG